MKRFVARAAIVCLILLISMGTMYSRQQNGSAATAGGVRGIQSTTITNNPVVYGTNTDASDGVDSYDQVAPPPPPANYLYAYFLLAPGELFPNYLVDIKNQESSLDVTAKIWALRAVSDQDGPVTLNLPIVGTLDPAYNPTLFDTKTGIYHNLRADPNYQYTSVKDETRIFQLLVGDKTKPTVTLTYPNGGELLPAGTGITITWTSADASGLQGHDVYYSLDGGSTYTLIGSTAGDVKSIGWTPPGGSTSALVKVVARDRVFNEQEDVSNGTFGTGYTITPTAGANGSMNPSVATVVPFGADQSFTMTPDPGYHVADVQVDASSVGAVTGYTFNSVIANHTISTTFAINTYTITASAGANGSVSPPGVTTLNYNGSQAYTITPNAGYHVVDVVVDGGSVGAVTSYNFAGVITNHTISATFAINTYTITASAGSNGSIAPSGVTTLNYNGSQAYTITPSTGYHVADVLVDGSSVGAAGSYTFTDVQSNHTIAATFAINTYTITASAGSNGSISSPGATTVNYGGSQAYTITPTTGYHVADVLVDGSSVGAVASYTFSNVNSNHTIAATFTIDTYTITASAGSNGSVSPSGATTVNYDGSQTYTITPSTGYHIADVLVDGSSAGAVSSYTFSNVRAGHTISATFAVNTYAITASAGANGSISPSGVTNVDYNGSQAYTISPATGYHVADVLVDAVSVGAVTGYSFSTVTSDHTISASFAINYYPLTVLATEGGTILEPPSSPVMVAHRVETPITAAPLTGYHWLHWTIDFQGGTGVTLTNPFQMSASVSLSEGPGTVVANFAINQYSVSVTTPLNGTVSLDPPGGTYDYNSIIQLTATPNTWHHFVNWTGAEVPAGHETDNPLSITVDGNKTLTANFAIDQYTVHRNAIAGWNLVGVPAVQADLTPSGVFGDDYSEPYYTFGYIPATGYAVPSTLSMGQGYWLGSNHPCTIDAVGTPLTVASLALAAGFNIIGNPFVTDEPFAQLRFTKGTETKTMAEAISSSWLMSALYKYNGAGYDYENTALGVWQGYWIGMLVDGITIQYAAVLGPPAPVTHPNAGAAPTATMTPTNWNVDIAATLATAGSVLATDRLASFGVRSDATPGFDPLYDAPRPPRSPAEEFIEPAFVVKGDSYPRLLGTAYARDYRGGDHPVWDCVVNTSKPGKVTLTWDMKAIGTLGDEVRAYLYDVSTQRIVDMKKVGSYSYEEKGTSRQFRIGDVEEAMPRAFQLGQNYPNPFNPVTVIRYGVPSEAVVSVEVFNSLGQKVATLVDGEKKPTGYHEVKFEGANLSTGLYFYRLSATGSYGTRFTDVKKMILLK